MTKGRYAKLIFFVETMYVLKRTTVNRQPFNSHERPRQNFSLQYKSNLKQTSDENKEKY